MKKIFLILILFIFCCVNIRANDFSYLVYDVRNKQNILDSNGSKMFKLGSFSGVYVVLSALDSFEKNDLLNISNLALDKQNPQNNLSLLANEEIYFTEIIKLILLNSNNDAINALAENISGDFEKFNFLINNKMVKWGFGNTIFNFPYHLLSRSSLNDFLRAFQLLIEKKEFLTLLKTKEVTLEKSNKRESLVLKNNFKELNLPEFEYGLYDPINNHLCAVFKDDNIELIILVTNAKSRLDLIVQAKTILKKALSNYQEIDLKEVFQKRLFKFKGDKVFHTHDVSIKLNKSDYLYLNKNQKLETKFRLTDPRNVNDLRAYLDVYVDQKLYKTLDLNIDITPSKVAYLNNYIQYFNYFFNIFSFIVLGGFGIYMIIKRKKHQKALKTFFIDVDGTILDHKRGYISDNVKQALKTLISKGHQVYLCTGRNFATANFDLGTEITGYILTMGSKIISNKQTIFDNPFPTKLVDKIIEESQKYGVSLNFETDEYCFGCAEVLNIVENKLDYLSKKYWLSFSEYNNEKVYKILGLNNDFKQHEQFKRQFLDVLTFHNTYANKIYDEIQLIENSKGQAIEFLAKKGLINLKDTVCVGDSYNDLSMFEVCAYKIALDNSIPELKNQADYISKSVEEDGFYYALKDLGYLD